MNATSILVMAIYLATVTSLIWARLFYFDIKTRSAKSISYLNDTAVAIQIATTCYVVSVNGVSESNALIAGTLYLLGVSLFWWAIVTAKKLPFAGNNSCGPIISSGPYALVRHPLYLSYSIIWLGSLFISRSWLIYMSFLVLLSLYLYSARKEESQILRGPAAADYDNYKKNVGMFIPFFFRSN